MRAKTIFAILDAKGVRLLLYYTDSRIIGEILVSIELIKQVCTTDKAIFAKQVFTLHCIWSCKINPKLSFLYGERDAEREMSKAC